MKLNKKFVGLLLALAMLFSLFAVNVAATDTGVTTSESTVTIPLNHSGIYSVTGSFEIIADEGVEYEIVSFTSTGSMDVILDATTQKFAGSSANAKNVSLMMVLTIKGAAGKTAKVQFNYEYQQVSMGALISADPVVYDLDVVDYTELKVQLARFDALNSSTYTNASWSVASSAASTARNLLNKSYKQSDVDAAASALKKAIDALVVLDVNYEALSAKVTEAKALDPNNFVAVNWYEFCVALSNAESFLNRQNAQDQASIDSMLKTLTDVMAALKSIDEIYNAGFEAGKTAGNTAGYEAGFAAGKDAGKTEGYESGKKEGYEAGKLAGIEEGKLSVDTEAYYKDGFDAGYDEGYEAGYAAGLAAGKAEDKEEETTSDGESTDSKDDETTPVVDDGEEKSATIWIVLFIVFLVTTLGLAAYIVLTMVLKKKKESDNTPVVDYNIEDDADAE